MPEKKLLLEGSPGFNFGISNSIILPTAIPESPGITILSFVWFSAANAEVLIGKVSSKNISFATEPGFSSISLLFELFLEFDDENFTTDGNALFWVMPSLFCFVDSADLLFNALSESYW